MVVFCIGKNDGVGVLVIANNDKYCFVVFIMLRQYLQGGEFCFPKLKLIFANLLLSLLTRGKKT